MILLKATTETLEVTTSSSSATDCHVSFVDLSSFALSGVSSQETAISSATTTTILSAPGSSTQRQVKFLTILNKGTSTNTISVKKDISGTEYVLFTATLAAGEKLSYTDGNGFKKINNAGVEVIESSQSQNGVLNSSSFNYLKVGATSEAAGLIHFLGLSSGFPGAWAIGTPGINGRATDGTNSADLGCLPVKNPVSGVNYLTNFSSTATTASFQLLLDLMWVNTGLVVTTTTAQSITPVSLPARSLDGTSNGEDVMAGILVTTATTNASAVTNTTMSYTNSDGTSGKTATISSFPATAVAGTLIPFQLASGDKGVRSVQSVTLGTSYAAGAISLVLFRVIAGVPVLIANAGGKIEANNGFNIKLFNGSCLLPAYYATATTATTAFGSVTVEEK